jgi:hypothetical protein
MMYRGVEVQLHTFLTSALYGDEWLDSCPVHFTHRKEPWYIFDRKLGGPQSWSGHNAGKKNLALQGTETQSYIP